ncbi:hypothetical protein ACIGO8_33405 [Streptomyces sp. NPDC053493]|uniref:hypothetical protein n=1 Tax=Streptomyces sp. NPDC053493 TaxID=3365705 RepID=UPI0037D5BBD9
MGGVLLLFDRFGPKSPFTLEDWAEEANGICDQNYSAETQATAQATASLIAAETAPTTMPAEQFQGLVYKAAGDVGQIAGSLRKVRNQFDDIKRPEGHGDDVDQALKKLDELSRIDADYADAMRRLTTGEQVLVTEQVWLRKRNEVAAGVQEALTKLGATQCFRKSE